MKNLEKIDEGVVVEISNLAQTSKSYPLPFETNPQGPPPSPHHLHPSPKAMPFFLENENFYENVMGFWQILEKFWKISRKIENFLKKIEKNLKKFEPKFFKNLR